MRGVPRDDPECRPIRWAARLQLDGWLAADSVQWPNTKPRKQAEQLVLCRLLSYTSHFFVPNGASFSLSIFSAVACVATQNRPAIADGHSLAPTTSARSFLVQRHIATEQSEQLVTIHQPPSTLCAGASILILGLCREIPTGLFDFISPPPLGARTASSLISLATLLAVAPFFTHLLAPHHV